MKRPRPRRSHASGEDAANWAKRIEQKDLELADLIRLSRLRTLSGPERALGERFYDQAIAAFKAKERKRGEAISNGAIVSVFGSAGCGVYVSAEKALWYSIMERAIKFDWSEAHRMLGKVQIFANRARDLWPVDLSSLPEEPRWGLRRWRWRRALKRIKRAVAERQPHAERAYEVCTSLFSAITLEKLARDEDGVQGREPSQDFLKRVSVIGPSIENAEREFDRAAQRYARSHYGKGMILGVVSIGLLCGALAIVFQAHGVPAWNGVALLAGGVGAVVSVLQRMASGRLRLDYDAGPGTLIALGGVRPLIGAIFGMVLFGAVEGGWLPAIEIKTGEPLAFYAVLGFLAGFNERFAQDMLVASAGQLGIRSAGSSESAGATGASAPAAQGQEP